MTYSSETISYASARPANLSKKRRYLRLWVAAAIILLWQTGLWCRSTQTIELTAGIEFDHQFHVHLFRGYPPFYYVLDVATGYVSAPALQRAYRLNLLLLRIRSASSPGSSSVDVALGVPAPVILGALLFLTLWWRKRYVVEARRFGPLDSSYMIADLRDTFRMPLTFLLFASLCWLGMMWVHESGHVIAGLLSAGIIDRVVLDPRGFSRTDMFVNPHPLVTAWGGPLFGAAAPAIAAAIMRRIWSLRLFAAFCLFANGIYIFLGSFKPMADAGAMLKFGSPLWALWFFGLAAMTAGVGVAWTMRRRAASDKPAISPTPKEMCIAVALTGAMIVVGILCFKDAA